MGPAACGLAANLVDWVDGPRGARGHPRRPTEAVLETVRFFLREGVQRREPRATGDRVCGATLRRRLSEWSTAALRLLLYLFRRDEAVQYLRAG